MIRIAPYVCLTIAAGMASAAMAQNPPYNCQNLPTAVQIAAQPMKTALAELSRQYSCPISIDAKVDDLYSQTVDGTMTPIQASVLLVQGTGLEAIPVKQGIGVGYYEQDILDNRIQTLQTKVDDAVKSGRITKARAVLLRRQLLDVKVSAHCLARKQGFVSAAEKASYRRTLDAVGKAVS